jgi:3-oxoacyl-[acyl-carrier protein] reductase
MAQRLAGRVAVITGASAGIGGASALALAAEGVRLVVTARRADRLDALAAQIRTHGSEAIAVAGDAREEETAQRTVSAAVQTFGGIDLLINNAGIGNYKDLVATSAAEYDELMDSNMRSTFLFTRHTVPVMIARGTGTILIVSSMAWIYALGKGRTAESVAQSAMLEPEDVAAAVVLACTQAPGSRIIEIQMRPMSEPLA